VTLAVATAQYTTSAGIEPAGNKSRFRQTTRLLSAQTDAPAPSVAKERAHETSISRGNRRRMATDVIEWCSTQQKHASDA